MATSHISGLYVKSKCSVHLDADYVAAYDEKSPTDWSEDVATLQALGIGPTSTVVDLGAGTGTFALAIAPHVARVVAVDVSEPMVAAMRARGIEGSCWVSPSSQ